VSRGSLFIIYLPVLETLFGTEPILLAQCVAWIMLGAIPFLVLEVGKIKRQSRMTPLQLHTERPGL
jgi:hypothetical protein